MTTKDMNSHAMGTLPDQVLSMWSNQALMGNSVGSFGNGGVSMATPSLLMRATEPRVALIPSSFPDLEKVRSSPFPNQSSPKQQQMKQGLTLEEIVADHDLNESSTTLETSLHHEISGDDESASDIDGIFDDDDTDDHDFIGSRKISPIKVLSTSSSSPPPPSAPVSDSSSHSRFKPFHEEKWNARLKELVRYRQDHGDCLVPHTYNPNPQLARWVKRQRRQYKLMLEGRASTMTPERLQILNDIDFVWDSHEAAWHEKLKELQAYRKHYGNCLVPSNYKKNPQLATWVKCQRRQYKLYWEGRASAMTPERIVQLENIGFEWEIRSSHQANLDRSDYLLLSEAISKMN